MFAIERIFYFGISMVFSEPSHSCLAQKSPFLFSIAANRQLDLALYIGVSVALLVIGGLGYFLARLFHRKGRDHSLYSMARSGKYHFFFFLTRDVCSTRDR